MRSGVAVHRLQWLLQHRVEGFVEQQPREVDPRQVRGPALKGR